MLKKIVYIKSYPSGLRVESLLGRVNIGFNNKLTHKNFIAIVRELVSILDELRKDNNFKTIYIKSHLLIDRKLLRKLENNSSGQVTDDLINKKFLKILTNNNYNFKHSTTKISIFRKYVYFLSMKIGLYLKKICTCNYTNKKTFRIPDTNYMGNIEIFL